jgi:GNAT superfamily N-acetyltransferase
MSDRLRMDPMTGAELESFIDYSSQVYIDDRVTMGGEDRRDAQEIEARQFATYFPGRQPAHGHSLFTGRNAATGEQIGILWLFERTSAAGTSVFIYDVEVKEESRARGWGRELMAYAEQWAHEHGAREIALNVFGRNTVARGLYSSLGYSERSVSMAKPLTTPTTPTTPTT